jgi:uncharacterized protein YciI
MPKSQYIYVLKIASEFDPMNAESWTDDHRRTLDRHFTYLRALTDDGTMIFVGRSVEPDPFAIAVFEADSEDEAQTIMEGDPVIASGMMRGTLHPFHIVLTRVDEEEDPDSPKSDGGIH